jgi:hypothetical protein
VKVPAYTTPEAARKEAEMRFGRRLEDMDRWLQEVEAFVRIRELDEGLSRFAEARAAIKRALPSVAQADRLVRAGWHAFSYGEELPPILEDVPHELAQALALLRHVEESCRAVTKRRASRRGLKLDLVLYALKHKIKPVIKVHEEAAAWAYAFIALGLAEPPSPPRGLGEVNVPGKRRSKPGAEPDAWRLRLIDTNKLLDRARRIAGVR